MVAIAAYDRDLAEIHGLNIISWSNSDYRRRELGDMYLLNGTFVTQTQVLILDAENNFGDRCFEQLEGKFFNKATKDWLFNENSKVRAIHVSLWDCYYIEYQMGHGKLMYYHNAGLAHVCVNQREYDRMIRFYGPSYVGRMHA